MDLIHDENQVFDLLHMDIQSDSQLIVSSTTAAASHVLKITNQAIKKVKRVKRCYRSCHLIAEQACFNVNQRAESTSLFLFSAVALQQPFSLQTVEWSRTRR